jgi:hypothetical protein
MSLIDYTVDLSLDLFEIGHDPGFHIFEMRDGRESCRDEQLVIREILLQRAHGVIDVVSVTKAKPEQRAYDWRSDHRDPPLQVHARLLCRVCFDLRREMPGTAIK